MSTKLFISHYWIFDNPRNSYQQILLQNYQQILPQKFGTTGHPTTYRKNHKKAQKNGDISLTRPGQKKRKTLKPPKEPLHGKSMNSKKTVTKREREKRIFEQENHQMAPLKIDAISMGKKKPLPPC